MEYRDLMLYNGEVVRIEFPNKFLDEADESLRDTLKRGDTWSTLQFDGCGMTYMGLFIESVDMSKVIGFL